MVSIVDDTDAVNKLEFVDERERVHFAKAQLGEQVIAFLSSPAGRYLHGRARLQLKECQEVGLDCNPDTFFGRRKLRRVQHDADVAKCFMSWCADAIAEGEMSYRELKEYSRT